jgi:predicted aspartyl protease
MTANRFCRLSLMLLMAMSAAHAQRPPEPVYAPPPQPVKPLESAEHALEVPVHYQGGVPIVSVLVNEIIPLSFVLDSGAADVSIPADVVLTLLRTGSLRAEDFTGNKTYTLADGSSVPSEIFYIRSLKIGSVIVTGVSASVTKVTGSLLLGQSFLRRLQSWSLDNTRNVFQFVPAR